MGSTRPGSGSALPSSGVARAAFARAWTTASATSPGAAEGGAAVPDRHTLAVLAADPLQALEVAGHRVDGREDGDPVPDQVGPPDRPRDLPALDQVPLRDPEYEVAGGRVDLPTTQG